MSTLDSSSLEKRALKTKIWVTLGGGLFVCLIPFVGMAMWVLFVPVVIMAGRWSYKLIGMGETKPGLLHLVLTALFLPCAFVIPLTSTAVVSTLIWPPTASNSKSAGSVTEGQNPEQRTRETWTKLMTALNAMKEFNTSNTEFMMEGKGFLSQDGVIDLTIQVFSTVGQIKTEGADPELADFMKKLSGEGTAVFQQMKLMSKVTAGGNGYASQQEASAYAQTVQSLLVRLGEMDRGLRQMHDSLVQKYGEGFESPSFGGR